MSNPLDSDVQEDVRTFPMYQRLRCVPSTPLRQNGMFC